MMHIENTKSMQLMLIETETLKVTFQIQTFALERVTHLCPVKTSGSIGRLNLF